MAKHLVLAGGGHAHLEVLAHLGEICGRGHRVTLVSPQPWHYYSGMGPGLLGGFYTAEQIRFPLRALVEAGGGSFLADRVTAIDPAGPAVLLASGQTLACDLLSCNLGSEVRPRFAITSAVSSRAAKPIANLVELRAELTRRQPLSRRRILVVGGGPTGVELAGNLWRLGRQAGGELEITLAAGSRLLATFPARAHRLALGSLRRRGIEVIEGDRVAAADTGRARLEDGRTLAWDHLVLACGVQPPELFREAGLPTGPQGGLAVDACLRALGSTRIFGGGDCIDFAPRPLPRVGVYAVRQGPILRRNLLASLEGRPLEAFHPQPEILQILNLGDGKGLACRKGLVFDGRPAFWLKDWIDRRFMARFQG